VQKTRNKVSSSEYLAFLSQKYSVDVDSFFAALVSAGTQNRKSTCGSLAIECRGKNKGSIVVLITQDGRVVAQFPVVEDFFSRKSNPIKDAPKTGLLLGRCLVKKQMHPDSFQIKDLRIGMSRVNLKAGVLEVAKPRSVITRFGNCASVANALVSDGTGTIRLCLWNDQIDSVDAGDNVEIENARISAFKGEKQLRIGKNGTIRVAHNSIAT
jgi:replication factor A1